MTASPPDERAVSRILADLTDRRGLRQAWEDIDPDVQNEIIEKWQDIIRQESAAVPCDVCAGTGKPISGKRCMCGGSGKASDAVPYLRDQIAALEQRVEAMGSLLSRAHALLGTAIPLAGPASEYGSWNRWHSLKDTPLPEIAAALPKEPPP